MALVGDLEKQEKRTTPTPDPAGVAEVFMRIAELADARGIRKINELPGCCEMEVDDHWRVVVNGHSESRTWRDATIAPFHAYIEFNGFPAGIMSPRGGTIAAGTIANEDALIRALKVATKAARRKR